MSRLRRPTATVEDGVDMELDRAADMEDGAADMEDGAVDMEDGAAGMDQVDQVDMDQAGVEEAVDQAGVEEVVDPLLVPVGERHHTINVVDTNVKKVKRFIWIQQI